MLLSSLLLVLGINCASVTAATLTSHCKSLEVRKEWRKFSIVEKRAWTSAVKCLGTKPHSPKFIPSLHPPGIGPLNVSSTLYDDWVYLHMTHNLHIHATGFFFPWHRWYIYGFNKMLKDKCGYTGVAPYWDWTLDAKNFHESSFWQESSKKYGLGGWGDPSKDFAVPDGAFAGFKLAYPIPHALRRNFTLRPFQEFAAFLPQFFPDPDLEANATFTPAIVRNLTNSYTGDFVGLQTFLEGFEGMHSSVHNMIGGGMAGKCPLGSPADCIPGPTWSSNDPIFMMHHGMVDKIWADWQARSPQNARAFAGGSVQDVVNYYNGTATGGPPALNRTTSIPTDGLFDSVEIRDVLDTKALCYVYE